jgi:HAD superfamily hydrolase (TIGR01509 family)
MELWPVEAAIFDCDGLLVDTEECWHAAYCAVAARVGRSPDELPLDALNGASVDIAAQRLSESLGEPVSGRLVQHLLEVEIATRRHALLPGALELLNELHGQIPLAVASNAPLPVVEAVLAAAGADEFFAEVVAREAVPAPKPAPDVYLEACFRLSVDPAAAVAFEDSVVGAEAVRAAGMRLVAVPSQPGAEIEAHVSADRLDDPRIFALFNVAAH